MSLDWNSWKMPKETREALEAKYPGIVANFAWVSMSVDLGEVTEKNLHEWKVRVQALKMIGLFPLGPSGTGDNFPVNLLNHFVGYSTNVSTTTRRAFLSKIGRMVESRVTEYVRQAPTVAAALS